MNAKTTAKNTAAKLENAPADNVVRGIKFGDTKEQIAHAQAQFEKDFAGTGDTVDKILRYLDRRAEDNKRERATVVNMIALEANRAIILKWPDNDDAAEMRKEIKETIFDVSERGKTLNAQIEAFGDKVRGEDIGKLALLRSKRSYIIGKMVEARKVAGKIADAERNGFVLNIQHDNPNILLAHSTATLAIRNFTAGGLANVKSFVNIKDVTKLASRGTNDGGKKIEWRTGTAALPTIAALSGHIAKWAEDPKKYGITAAVSAELSVLFTNIAEVLNVPLNASQNSVLEGLSEAAPAAPEPAKTGTEN